MLLPTLLLLAVNLACTKASFSWHDTSRIVAFGDSYSFVQGSRGHANFSFIGDNLNRSFTPFELFTDVIIPHNTSSDGANWLEFLTGCEGGLPSLCSRQPWPFAYAGADIDGNLLPLHHDHTLPLVDQVEQFISYASPFLGHSPKTTLTTWFIGINDVGDTLKNASITSFPTFWETEMESYFNAVERAFTAGGLSGTHMFLNVPPTDRAPAVVGNAATSQLQKERIAQFNSALATHVQAFADAHSDATVILYDSNALFNRVLDNFEEFGFKNITGFCTCVDRDFFWYNTGHPTQPVHEIMAADIAATLLRLSD